MHCNLFFIQKQGTVQLSSSFIQLFMFILLVGKLHLDAFDPFGNVETEQFQKLFGKE